MPMRDFDAVAAGAAGKKGVPVVVAPLVLVTGIWLVSTFVHWAVRGFSWIVAGLSLFLAVTLLIYASALILAAFSARIDSVRGQIMTAGGDTRGELHAELTGRAAHGGFDPRYWVRAWALHTCEQPGFVDRRSYLFVVETGNAIINTVPVVFLLAMMTWQAVPAQVFGVIMAVVFYQILHGTCLYFVAASLGRVQRSAYESESKVFDFGANLPWILFPAAGIAVGVHLLITDSYSIALW
ncbi:hypothetical protein [Nocardia flavorosea]|uniref:hypothetical protein n=1 Tax=Nocardia flavorosea TaxID=53429 RepID=UPI0024542ED3|nr:hypothetical protein [Nocardia flavorosea]